MSVKIADISKIYELQTHRIYKNNFSDFNKTNFNLRLKQQKIAR